MPDRRAIDMWLEDNFTVAVEFGWMVRVCFRWWEIRSAVTKKCCKINIDAA